MQTARIPARTPLWLCWQPPFAADAQKLQTNFVFHPAEAGKTALLGEMEIIPSYGNHNCLCFLTFICLINAGRRGRAPQPKQCGILRRRRRVNKGLPIKWNKNLTA